MAALLCGMVCLLGAASRAAEPSATNEISEIPLTQFDFEHWAFRPLQRVEPQVDPADRWSTSEIDRFVWQGLRQAGLSPGPAADAATWLRRVTFDLTGLPPSLELIEKFLADPSLENKRKIVDELLASSAYGERMAMHWLDLVRFAESDGFEFDHVREHAWRYRDWVIDALNRDLPYDQFVSQQLAGDELFPGDERASAATGFLYCGPDMPDLNLAEERRHVLLNDLTSNVGSVFLGVQMGCAQCHDHKVDPISQADFYRLRGVFEPLVLFIPKDKPRVAAEETNQSPAPRLYVRGDFRRPGAELSAAFPRICNPWHDSIPTESANSSSQSSGRRSALARWLTRSDHPLFLRVIANRVWQIDLGVGLVRTPSDFGYGGDTPSHPELLDWLATELPRRNGSLKELHKLIVLSSTYGQASLLSAAANTAAGSENAAAAHSRESMDPENRLLGRMNRKRREGEAIRELLLAASGRLSPRRGGRGIMAPLPPELMSTLLENQWLVNPDEEEHYRRSIYLFVRRNLRFPLFEAFDRPDAQQSCPRRERSTTPLQSLVLLNSELSVNAARDLAGRLLSGAKREEPALIREAFLRVFSRPCSDGELSESLAFLNRQAEVLTKENRPLDQLIRPRNIDPEVDPSNLPSASTTIDPQGLATAYREAAWVDFCLALFNANEAIYVD